MSVILYARMSDGIQLQVSKSQFLRFDYGYEPDFQRRFARILIQCRFFDIHSSPGAIVSVRWERSGEQRELEITVEDRSGWKSSIVATYVFVQ
jgi:hypothetical protein